MTKTTKVFIFIITVSIVGMVFWTMSALSDTSLLFSTLSVNVEEGRNFNVVISIYPKDVKNYTAKIVLEFPTDLLEITSFDFDSDWMQVTQPGYDLIDNTKGVMIKTAGFPGGVSTIKVFGIVSFRAKKRGEGIIKVGGASFVLDAENQNVLAETPVQISVAITEKAIPEEFEIPEKIPEVYTFEKNLNPGDRNIDIAYLQICLTSEGFYSKDITGYFDSATREAVTSFQEEYFDDILKPWGFSRGTGLVNRTTRVKLDELCFVTPEEIPEQLFDISFEVDNTVARDIKELVSRVIFISFGKVPTPVNLTFVIEDEAGKEVYIEKDYIVVETEAVLTKKFESFELASGKYTLSLTTLYNVDVRDEFSQDFEIIEKEKVFNIFKSVWFWALVLIVLVIIITRRKLEKTKKIKKVDKKKDEIFNNFSN